MIETPPDVERMPATAPEADLLRLAQDAFTASDSYFNANLRREVEMDIRQWQGLHMRQSKYYAPSYAGRSKLFRPKTRSAILKAEAQAAEAFFSTVDVVNVLAYDRDDPMQEDAANFYKALLQVRLTEPPPRGVPWFLTALGAYQETLVTGVVISRAYWQMDEAKGINRPMVDLIPIENFRFDPAADWRDPVSTSPYLVHMIPMYVSDVKKRIAQGKWLPVEEQALLAARKNYADSIRLQRTGNRTDPKDVSHDVSDFSIVWVHENIVERPEGDILFYTLGTSALLSEAIPVEQQYAHGRPYVVGFSTIEAHRHYPSSMARLTRDVQREINDLANTRLDNVNFVLNKRYFVKRGAQVDLASISRNMPGSSTLMNNPADDVRVVETPDVTGSSYQEQDRLNLDFDDVAGQFASSSVQSNRSLNETVGGMNILTTNANQLGGYRLRTFVETWMEPVLRMLVEIERLYEDDERLLARAVQMAGIEVVGDWLWEEEVQVAVNVGMSATNPQEKANLLLFGFNSIKTLLADGALEQRGLNGKEVVKEIMGMLGYRDGSRFFRFPEDDPVVARMQEMVQQLQQQLAQKQPPELVAAQVAKYEAEVKRIAAETVAKGVQAAYSAMQAGQVIASVPSVAPIADEVMRSAGYQPVGGADPNYPQPPAPEPALLQGPVSDRRTGIEFQPPRENTSPAFPALPASAAQGVDAGIETQRPDGMR